MDYTVIVEGGKVVKVQASSIMEAAKKAFEKYFGEESTSTTTLFVAESTAITEIHTVPSPGVRFEVHPKPAARRKVERRKR
jgi:ribosomal protein L21